MTYMNVNMHLNIKFNMNEPAKAGTWDEIGNKKLNINLNMNAKNYIVSHLLEVSELPLDNI